MTPTKFLSTHGIEPDTQITYDKAIELLTAFKEEMCPKRKFQPPTQQDFVQYFKDNGYNTEIAATAFKGYAEADWRDSTGKQIKNWKQKCCHVWFKPQHKVQSTPTQTVKTNGFATVITNR